MKTAITSLCGLGIFLVSGLAAAQQYGGGYQGSYTPAPMPRSSGLDNIGEEAQITFGVDRVMGLGFDRLTYTVDAPGGGSDVDVTEKSTTVALFGNDGGSMLMPRLALDYFVVESISIGGSLVYISRTTESEADPGGSADGPTTTTFAVAPRVGYAMAFDETFSIWPRAGITYFSSKVETPGATSSADTTTTTSGLDLTVEVPVGISPIENFAILAGPYLDFGLSGTQKTETSAGDTEQDGKLTSYGLAVGILGYY